VTGQAVVQGTVAQSGRPAEGAYVRLLDTAGEFVAEVRTGRAGDFRFFAAPGDWTVRIVRPAGDHVNQLVTASLGRVTEVAVEI
jgi:hypothetical protein